MSGSAGGVRAGRARVAAVLLVVLLGPWAGPGAALLPGGNVGLVDVLHGPTGIFFGYSVDSKDGRLAVGAFGQFPESQVHLFQADGEDGWQPMAVLEPTDPNRLVGRHVALLPNGVASSSPSTGTRTSITIFEQGPSGGWVETVISPPAVVRWDFGLGLQASGSVLVAGFNAFSRTTNLTVPVFERAGNGTWVTTLVEVPNSTSSQPHAVKMAVDGDRLAVLGLSYTNPRVALFQREAFGAWRVEALVGPTAAPDSNHHEGSTVALEGPFLVLGRWQAPFGRIYVAEEMSPGNWTSVVLPHANPQFYDFHGRKLSLSEGRILAPADEVGTDLVNYFLYDRGDGSGEWTETRVDTGLSRNVGSRAPEFALNRDRLAIAHPSNVGVVHSYRIDADGDRLFDDDETGIYGTSPFDRDSDDDRLEDGDEVQVYRTDPAVFDTDVDQLGDGDEVLDVGTDPLHADTDRDWLTDGNEVLQVGTSPLLADTDADGLTDGAEVLVHGTNPLVADTDGEGLLDGAEVLVHSTDPLRRDSDGDLYHDGVEVACGSAPRSVVRFPLPTCALPTELPPPPA